MVSFSSGVAFSLCVDTFILLMNILGCNLPWRMSRNNRCSSRYYIRAYFVTTLIVSMHLVMHGFYPHSGRYEKIPPIITRNESTFELFWYKPYVIDLSNILSDVAMNLWYDSLNFTITIFYKNSYKIQLSEFRISSILGISFCVRKWLTFIRYKKASLQKDFLHVRTWLISM